MKNRLAVVAWHVVGWTLLTAYVSAAQTGGATPAEITAIVPAGAEVYFDGQPTTQTGAARVYSSPPLEPGEGRSLH
jgi:hypothetical protein